MSSFNENRKTRNLVDFYFNEDAELCFDLHGVLDDTEGMRRTSLFEDNK